MGNSNPTVYQLYRLNRNVAGYFIVNQEDGAYWYVHTFVEITKTLRTTFKGTRYIKRGDLWTDQEMNLNGATTCIEVPGVNVPRYIYFHAMRHRPVLSGA